MERLVHERAVALGSAIDSSTALTYNSALNSYLEFCKLHNFPIEPTADTLSFYVVFMSHHIEPRSVDSYLSGICNQLEPFFPNIRGVRRSNLVTRSLKGCKRLRSKPVNRKLPLSKTHLQEAASRLGHDPSLDDLLWLAMLFTGFHGLLRLGEMAASDDARKRNTRKYTRRLTVSLNNSNYSFTLKSHKADRFFEGNTVLITDNHALTVFREYLSFRDATFPLHPFLWVRQDGSVPTRRWFMQRFRVFMPDRNFAGQSMRAGGATALAGEGAPPHVIQAAGRWRSDTFQIYIRKHPMLLQAMLHGVH